MPKVKMNYNKVLVKVLDTKAEEKKGSIIIPDSVEKAPSYRLAEIVALGPETTPKDHTVTEVLPISVGDKVVIGQFGGIEVTLEEEKYVIITYADILLIKEA